MHVSSAPYISQKTTNSQAITHLTEKMKSWHYTLYHHAVNVAFLTRAIATDQGLRGSELEQVIQGAFFHDIGKISWPRRLVGKKRLDKYDWKIIQEHPIVGELYLHQQLPETPDLVLRIIREHHERPDGGGYPNGLKDNKIHPFSLMVSTVEVYVALTEDRPYRPAWRKKDTLAELIRQGFPEEIINLIRKMPPTTVSTNEVNCYGVRIL